MKSRFLKAALAVVSACTLMACCPEKENNAAAQGAATPAAQSATEIASAAQQTKDENMNKLTLTAEWDKVFPKSDKVEHSKVTFKNQTRSNIPRSLSRTILALNSPLTCSCPRTRASR